MKAVSKINTFSCRVYRRRNRLLASTSAFLASFLTLYPTELKSMDVPFLLVSRSNSLPPDLSFPMRVFLYSRYTLRISLVRSGM